MPRSLFFFIPLTLLVMVAPWPSSAVQAADVSVDSLWQEAQQLDQSGQYAQAVDRYRSILSQETRWKKRAKAALLAANCLDQIGRSTESIPLLDAAIAEADNLLAQNKPGIDESWTLSALTLKAATCERTGDKAGALKTIERIRAQFFKSDDAREVLQIKARLEGWSPQKLADALNREQQAMQLAEQAAAASKQRLHDEALQQADRVIQEYPETAAVFPAMRTKALELWNQSRYREAKHVYQAIIDRVGPIAPHSRLVHTAQYRVAWLDAGALLKDLVARRRRGAVIAQEQWQRLDGLCAEVAAKDPDPLERAMARIMAIEGLNWLGRSDEVLARVEQFFNEYAGDRKLARFKEQIAAAHVFAGIALRRLGRYDEALVHFRWVIRPPEGQPENWLSNHTLEAARLNEWFTLRAAGLEGSVIQAFLRYQSGTRDPAEAPSNIQRLIRADEENAGR